MNVNVTTPIYEHAVIVGDGLSALLAAEVLTSHFSRITIVRPESNIGDAQPSLHPPYLLHARAQQLLEERFPGLLDELDAAGAISFNMGLHVEWFLQGRWRPRYQSNIEAMSCSRELLEKTLLKRISSRPVIHLLSGREAVGLCFDESGERVSGVRLRSLRQTDGLDELSATLVIDATGPDSPVAAWLEQAGIALPLVKPAATRTASRLYRRPDHQREFWQMIVIQPSPPHEMSGAVILPVEGNCLHVTLMGAASEFPLEDEEAFERFAQSLPASRVIEILQNSQPASPLFQQDTIEQPRRRVEPTAIRLEDFIVLGESGGWTNPAQGREPTLAALASETLKECLDSFRERGEGLDGFSREFHRHRAAAFHATSQMALNEERQWTSDAGAVADPPTPMSHYMEHVLTATLNSAIVLEAVYRVQQLLDPPSLFFRPDIVLQVIGALPRTR